MAKVKTVTLLLSKLVTDRNQYKPYMAELASPLEHPVYVQIVVPDDTVIPQGSDEVTVITVDGLAAVLSSVADAIDEMHAKYKADLIRHNS